MICYDYLNRWENGSPGNKREVTMNNKTKFIKAHSIARSTVAEVGDYQIAFKLALIELNKQHESDKTVTIKSVVNMIKSIDLDSICFMIVAVFMCVVLFGTMFVFAASAGNTIGATGISAIGAGIIGLVVWSVIEDTKDRYNRYYKNKLAY